MMKFPDLLPQHVELINASAISKKVATARGYWSIQTKADLKRLGFSDVQRQTPGLITPVYGITGEIVNYQLRSDVPRVRNGKPIKYETPSGSRMALDLNPIARPWLNEISRPLFITEGLRKADAAVSKGLCCVGLLGVYNWRGKVDGDAAAALPDWEMIPLKGRKVYICFDNDVMQKPQVRAALKRLSAFLKLRGADVRIIYLPEREGGAKLGLDDHFAEGHSVSELLKHATTELLEGGDESENVYEETARGLIYNKPTRDGSVEIHLTNFTARVTRDVLLDDGLEKYRNFEVEASLLGPESVPTRGSVPSQRFASMQWITELLGPRAIVYPGMLEHARCAVQTLSHDIAVQHVYTHTGWREVAGQWMYLHGGGAISADGPCDVEVQLPDTLQHFKLPEPPTGQLLKEAIRASLAALDLAPLEVTSLLFGAAWAAMLGGNDFSIHLAGETGGGKTELSALVQQHFGAGFDARHLPASWSSTGNANEAIAHTLKDAVCVVDDFAPTGTAQDVSRFHRDADRLLRAQGNNAGRSRMRADSSLRASKPPRGVILSTGEDLPRGQSARARGFITELSKSALDWGKLSACQRDARRGLYAAAMSAHLRRLAPVYGDFSARAHDELAHMRDQLFKLLIGHRRTPSTVAQLMRGWDYFLETAVESNAITTHEATEYRDRIQGALLEAARRQAGHHISQEPAARFIDLLNAAIASKRVHLADTKGNPPTIAYGDHLIEPDAFAWKEDLAGNWMAQGERIGWVGGENIYLQPEAAFAAAQRMATSINDTLTVSAQTLWKRLREGGYLASTDEARGTLKVRRTTEGVSKGVIHIRATTLFPKAFTDNAETDISDVYTAAEQQKSSTRNDASAYPEQLLGGSQPGEGDSSSASEAEQGAYKRDVGNVGSDESITSIAVQAGYETSRPVSDETQKSDIHSTLRHTEHDIDAEAMEERIAIMTEHERSAEDIEQVLVGMFD